MILQLALEDRHTPFTKVAKRAETHMGRSFGRHLISRRLEEEGYHRRRAVKRPAATEQNLAARLLFANLHINWPEIYWHRVQFSDE